MEHTVGRTAKGHIHRQGVQDGFFGHDVSWTDVLLPQLHHLHAGLLGQTDPGGVDRRDGPISPKPHSQHFRQTVHTVGGIHTGTGTAGRTGVILILQKLFVGDLARRVGSHRLKHTGQAGLLSLHMAGQHRTAADEDGGHVDPGSRHQKSGHVLVTVGHHHQGVKLMGHGHGLCGIRDQVPGHQRVFHPDMPHGDAVAHCDGRKYDGGSPCHGYSLLDCLHDLIQIHMAGNNLIVRADDPYQGPLHLLLGKAQGVKQRTVRGLLFALCHGITSHSIHPPLVSD